MTPINNNTANFWLQAKMLIFFCTYWLGTTTSEAQIFSQDSSLAIQGYLENYYSFDLAQPNNHKRQPFVFSHNQHNEFTTNLALLQIKYSKEKVRANIGFMAGTYANANLTAEEGVLKNIFEANIGVKLSNTKNLWLDMGIMPAHIGFEGAIGADYWTLTRGILADNSPYYESGAKISYTTDNQKWFVSALILNGWQRIQRIEGNNTIALGHQLTWTPTKNILFNSSSFVGSDTPDSTQKMRYFHDFYTQIQLSPSISILLGFDVGLQQKAPKSDEYNIWQGYTFLARYKITDKTSITARAEYYQDENGVIINTNTPNGFQTFGYSLNFDYKITENSVWRLEARTFQSKDKIFSLDKKPSSENYFFTTSLAIFLR